MNDAAALRRENAKLLALLKLCALAMQQEFNAMGDDWKDQPIMRSKAKILRKVQKVLGEKAAQ